MDQMALNNPDFIFGSGSTKKLGSKFVFLVL